MYIPSIQGAADILLCFRTREIPVDNHGGATGAAEVRTAAAAQTPPPVASPPGLWRRYHTTHPVLEPGDRGDLHQPGGRPEQQQQQGARGD